MSNHIIPNRMASGDQFFIALYGGHQQSSAVAFDGEKKMVVETSDPINLHTFSQEESRKRIKILLSKLSSALNTTTDSMKARTKRLTFTLAGAATEEDQDLAKSCLVGLGWTEELDKVTVIDDTLAGLVAGTFGSKGICAFGGAGASIYVGLSDTFERKHKIDGWGPIIGDYGSGFQLVAEFFRELCRKHDTDTDCPLFQDLLRADPTLESMSNVQRWFDSNFFHYEGEWRLKFASLGEVITQAADRPRPDADALRLIKKSAKDMSESILIAIDKFKPHSYDLPVVFIGGMFEHCRTYLAEVKRRLSRLPQNTCDISYYRPIVGALMISVSGNFNPTTEIVSNIQKRIDSLQKHELEPLLTAPYLKKLSESQS